MGTGLGAGLGDGLGVGCGEGAGLGVGDGFGGGLGVGFGVGLGEGLGVGLGPGGGDEGLTVMAAEVSETDRLPTVELKAVVAAELKLMVAVVLPETGEVLKLKVPKRKLPWASPAGA